MMFFISSGKFIIIYLYFFLSISHFLSPFLLPLLTPSLKQDIWWHFWFFLIFNLSFVFLVFSALYVALWNFSYISSKFLVFSLSFLPIYSFKKLYSAFLEILFVWFCKFNLLLIAFQYTFKFNLKTFNKLQLYFCIWHRQHLLSLELKSLVTAFCFSHFWWLHFIKFILFILVLFNQIYRFLEIYIW